VALALSAAGAGYLYPVLAAATENIGAGPAGCPSPRRFEFNYVFFHIDASVSVRDYIMCGGKFYALCTALF
jgi:hypothetical protein